MEQAPSAPRLLAACKPPAPALLAFPGVGSQPWPPLLVIALGAERSLWAPDAEQLTHPAKKGRMGFPWGLGGKPGLVGLVFSLTEAFLPASDSLGSLSSEPRGSKARAAALSRHQGHPAHSPNEEGAPCEWPPACARPTVAKRGGGKERRESEDRRIRASRQGLKDSRTSRKRKPGN